MKINLTVKGKKKTAKRNNIHQLQVEQRLQVNQAISICTCIGHIMEAGVNISNQQCPQASAKSVKP